MSKLHSVKVKGKELRCLVCGHGEFAERATLMSEAGWVAWGMDFQGKDCRSLICAECGFIHEFVRRPVEVTGQGS
jgi:hypothetical protein